MKRFMVLLLTAVLILSLLVTGCKRAPTATPTQIVRTAMVTEELPIEATPMPAFDRTMIFPLAPEKEIHQAITQFAADFGTEGVEPTLAALPDGLVVTHVETGIEYMDGVILLVFTEEATPDDVTRILEEYRLMPLGMIPELGVVQAWIPDERSPWDIADELAENPALAGAGPDIIKSFDDIPSAVIGEQMPKAEDVGENRLTVDRIGQVTSNSIPSAWSGDKLAVAAERFGNLGSGGFSAPSGGFGHNALKVMWPHFVMQTFAAHALVDKVGLKKPTTTRIAIIDDGIGDGKRPNPSPDLPASRCPQPNFVIKIEHEMARTVRHWFTWTVKYDTVTIVRVMGASIDTNGIKSVGGHGHAVAHCAAADGTSKILGTGKDALVRMIRIANDKGSYPTQWERLALESALNDPNVRVINLSFGTSGDEPPFGTVTRAANCEAAQSDGLFYRPFLTKAGKADKIVVMAAGNEGINIEGTNSPPCWAASKPGTRTGFSNEIAVAATDITSDYQIETQVGFSQFGSRVTVSAPGGYDHYTYTTTNTIVQQAGTSFAAPYVAGLAAEMLIVGQGLTKTPTASQVVHLIEATADDLVLSQPLPTNTTLTPAQQAKQALGPAVTCPVVDIDPKAAGWQVTDHNKETSVTPRAAGDGWDPYFGYGRINVWKAILAVLNGGLPIKPAGQWSGNIAGPIKDGPNLWYGFQIKTKVKNASVWISDGKKIYQLEDKKHPNPATGAAVVAWKGVKQGVVPVGVNVKNGQATDGWFMATFTISGTHLFDLDGNANTKPVLELRQPGSQPPAAPFYRLPIELEKMRQGKIGGVSFNNWVFTVETTATKPLPSAPTSTPTSTPTPTPVGVEPSLPTSTPTATPTVTPKPPKVSVGMEPNVDRMGMDYSNFDLPEANPELCRDACLEDSRCAAYTYVKPGVQGPKARCWLKYGVPAPITDDCCVSGVKTGEQ